MSLTAPCIEMLMDLIEIKLGTMEVYDNDDTREFHVLKRCREELGALKRGVPMHELMMKRPVGRPRRIRLDFEPRV